MQIHFLGTGAGVPSKNRNVTSVLLDILHEANEIWMFDCGEATQHQILHTSIRPRKISKIFITHLHGDHIYGLPGFLSSRSFQGGESPVQIFGPNGIEVFVQTALKISETKLSYDLEFIETKEGIVFEDENFFVHAKKLIHGVESYGYIIQQRDMPGPLIVEKLIEKGIKPGPIYQEIKEKENVTLPNGEIIQTKDFKGAKKKGKKIAIIGDTKIDDSIIPYIKEADVLVHEATFSKQNQDLAAAYFHSTTTDAATIAKLANVKQLIMTHISSRYQDTDISELVEEAKEIFNECIIANDFDTYRV